MRANHQPTPPRRKHLPALQPRRLLLLGFLTQDFPQNFARRTLGNGIHKQHTASQLFVVRNLVFYPFCYLLACKIFGGGYYICSAAQNRRRRQRCNHINVQGKMCLKGL